MVEDLGLETGRFRSSRAWITSSTAMEDANASIGRTTQKSSPRFSILRSPCRSRRVSATVEYRSPAVQLLGVEIARFAVQSLEQRAAYHEYMGRIVELQIVSVALRIPGADGDG